MPFHSSFLREVFGHFGSKGGLWPPNGGPWLPCRYNEFPLPSIICVDFPVHLEHFSNQTTKLIEKSHTNVLKHSKKIVILKKRKKCFLGTSNFFVLLMV